MKQMKKYGFFLRWGDSKAETLHTNHNAHTRPCSRRPKVSSADSALLISLPTHVPMQPLLMH